MTLAENAREAVRRRPSLLGALRAGVVNYTAAARSLADEVDGDTESIATALRRFGRSLPDPEPSERDVRVSMQSGLATRERSDAEADALLAVDGTALESDSGSLTAVVAVGEVDGRALAHVLDRLDAVGVETQSAGIADETLVVAVERRDGPDALRIVEDALAAVPSGIEGSHE